MPLFQNEALCKTLLMKRSFKFALKRTSLGRTHFHMSGFPRRLVLTQSQKAKGNGLFDRQIDIELK